MESVIENVRNLIKIEKDKTGVKPAKMLVSRDTFNLIQAERDLKQVDGTAGFMLDFSTFVYCK